MKMEDAAQLDITDDIDLAALHKVFIPIINDHLGTFQRSHIHHKIRTAENKTPLQLYHTAIDGGHYVDFITEVFFYCQDLFPAVFLPNSHHLDQWFPTGGTSTPWGYQQTPQGVPGKPLRQLKKSSAI